MGKAEEAAPGRARGCCQGSVWGWVIPSLLPPAFVSAASPEPRQQRRLINRNTVFAWIIHAKSTFPDQCRGLAEGEGGRGEQTRPGRMRLATGCSVSMAMGSSPGTPACPPCRAGDPSQHPKAGISPVRGVPLPSHPQEWGSAPTNCCCPSHRVTMRCHHHTCSAGEDPHPVFPHPHGPQLKPQLPAARVDPGSTSLPALLTPGLPGIN